MAVSGVVKRQAGPAEKKSWRDELSDAGLFSYGALCAVSLHYLYSDTPAHRSFQESCLSALVTELKLAQSKQVSSSLSALLDGQGSDDMSAFIDMLCAEPVVERIGLQQIPEDLVTVAIKGGSYDARVRVLIRQLTTVLSLDWGEVEEFERSLITSIKGEAHQMSEEEKAEKEKSALKRKVKKYTLIGLATVGGGALLGLTGGLAAPLLAAGAGAVIGGAGAAALGSVAGVAIIGSLFGVAGAGLGGYKMNKRVGDIEEFEFETLCEEGDLNVTIAISGWITENEPDFRSPWANLTHSRDQYCLRYESEHLKTMGAAMDYILSMAVSAATQETLKYTILSGLLAAVAWPVTLLSASSIIDNPWSVCTHRTAAAGKQLAEVLLAREQGKRPVTLIGFSLGARVVFYCLTEMAKRKNCEGIVQDAILLGAPVTGSSSQWAQFSRVVSGRIVNGYCKGDWLLRFLYRTASVQFSIAGLQPIKWSSNRMVNVDLSEIVSGHLDYWNKIDLILSLVGVRTSMTDYVCTGTPATEDMGEQDQWLVVENAAVGRNLPSSGFASGATTPSSSQATDPFPGSRSSPLPRSPPGSRSSPGSRSPRSRSPMGHHRPHRGHSSVSTDSGLDRDAEFDGVCSATDQLTLRSSEERRSVGDQGQQEQYLEDRQYSGPVENTYQPKYPHQSQLSEHDTGGNQG